MVAVTMSWTTNGPAHLAKGDVDWENDTIKAALLNAVPDQDTTVYWDDISSTEVTGTNWSAGGQTLASASVGVNTSTNVTKLDAADVSVASVTVSGVEAIAIYKDTGTASTSPVLGIGDLGATGASSGGSLDITWNASGILTLTAS